MPFSRTPGLVVMYIISFLFFSVVSLSAAGTEACTRVHTDKGIVSGIFNNEMDVCSYLGIPYAAPPIGELRFAMPREHEPWDEIFVADEYSDQCLQFPLNLYSTTKVTGNEDCLYLNIWHPNNDPTELMPVMVFIHGGGFIYGSGAQEIYEGTRLAKRGDVVVVTMNYRLGPFGFFAHPALNDEKGRTGNYGIYDMIRALEWTKNNIRNFGGNPENITIFGESAGGISVGVLLASPLGRDLFHRAIIESGPVVLLVSTLDKAIEESLYGAETLGCSDPDTAAECLRELPADEFMKRLPPTLDFISEEETEGGRPYMPISGTDLIPDPLILMLEKGDFSHDIPVMLGSNKDEAAYFTASKKIGDKQQFDQTYDSYSRITREHFGIDAFSDDLKKLYPLKDYETPKKAFNDVFGDVAFTCPAILLAKQIAANQPDVFLYHFTKSPQDSGPLSDWGAFHGSELAFVFGNFTFMGIKFESTDNSKLSSEMIAYWSSFARDGRPSGEGLQEWPQFSPEHGDYIVLGKEITVDQHLKNDKCILMEEKLLKIVRSQPE